MSGLIAAGVIAVIASGCAGATGGGWIQSSVNPLEKATFALNAKCRDVKRAGQQVAVIFDGHVTYHDPPAGVKIHGDVQPFEFSEVPDVTCAELQDFQVFPPGTAMIEGNYRSQIDSRTGMFVVEVADGGKPKDGADFFRITLMGGITYFNEGVVQGGNITIHD